MAVTTTSVLTEPVRAAYNMLALKAFTEQGQFWRAAATQPANMAANGGSSAVFDIWSTAAVTTAPLSESSDGTAVSLAMTQVTVTPKEYGDFVQTTRKLDLTSYSDTAAHAAWNVGQMANDKLDLVARDALDSQTGATWNDYGGGGTTRATSVATITKGNELTANDVRKAYAKLRALKVPKVDGSYYFAYIHPHVMKDLKDETGDASWTKKALYEQKLSDPIMDEDGIFEGFRFIISTNCNLQSKAGNGTTTSAASADVYTTYFMGADALGLAHNGDYPQAMFSDPVQGVSDAYKRFTVVSWYAFIGFGALRDDSLFKIYSSSSLAANGA